jgi:hypothetical protein
MAARSAATARPKYEPTHVQTGELVEVFEGSILLSITVPRTSIGLLVAADVWGPSSRASLPAR